MRRPITPGTASWDAATSHAGIAAPGNTTAFFASGSDGDRIAVDTFWSLRNPGPPWYLLCRPSLSHCTTAFLPWLESMQMQPTTPPGSTASCAAQRAPEQARQTLLGHLKQKGYQTP